jgi:hypothetical protein
MTHFPATLLVIPWEEIEIILKSADTFAHLSAVLVQSPLDNQSRRWLSQPPPPPFPWEVIIFPFHTSSIPSLCYSCIYSNACVTSSTHHHRHPQLSVSHMQTHLISCIEQCGIMDLWTVLVWSKESTYTTRLAELNGLAELFVLFVQIRIPYLQQSERWHCLLQLDLLQLRRISVMYIVRAIEDELPRTCVTWTEYNNHTPIYIHRTARIATFQPYTAIVLPIYKDSALA